MNIKSKLIRTGIFLGFSLMCFSVQADTHYVSLDGTNNSPYLNWADASTNIEWAVDAAEATGGDTVLVSNGTYYLTNRISINKGVIVTSLNGAASTIVDGNYQAVTTRCFLINHADAVLDGFTITNGVDERGGGIYIQAAGGLVKNCVVTDNQATNAGGGGIYCLGGVISNCVVNNNNGGSSAAGGIMGQDCLISDCSVYENQAQLGGGICLSKRCIVRRCNISNNYSYSINSANGGGGVELASGTSVVNMRIEDSVIAGNWSAKYGGGVMMYGTGSVSGCTIVSNVATNGGGVFCYNAGSVISNCVISENWATNGTGGGVYLGKGRSLSDSYVSGNHANRGAGVQLPSGGEVKNCVIVSNISSDSLSGAVLCYVAGGTVINCTVVGNISTGSVNGGIVCYQGGDVYNTIAWSNVGSAVHARNNVYVSGGAASTGVVHYSCVDGTNGIKTGYNNITNHPAFIDYSASNYRLSRDSPCVNTGTNQSWMVNAKDLDERSRIDRFSGIVDMGAYEYLPSGTIYNMQ